MKRKLYIFGARNFAEVCHHLFTRDSDYDVAGFVVDGKYLDSSTFCGLPVIAYEEFRLRVRRDDADIFLAIGVDKINTVRAEKFEQLLNDNCRFASFVSSSSPVGADFLVQPNTMIMEHVLIHPRVQVGKNSIIWMGSRIAIKAAIGDHCWVTSAAIGDSAKVGDYSFIGLNATIAPTVTVGSHNLIGACAAIMQDTKDYAVYRGQRSMPSPVSSVRLRNLRLVS